MAQQQKHRAPKLKTTQSVDQESTLSITPEAISLDKDDHVVQEKQSYTMVTGLLQVMVASIAYQRDLFPKTCFELRLPSVIRREAHPSYEQAEARSNKTASDDEMAYFATALAQQDQPLIVLAPGKTNGVDKLLAWLDGIFKGLLDRSLDGAQFSIYADRSRPSQVLELYTFSFQYRHGKDGERRLMGLTPPGHGSGTITTRSVRSGMINVIGQLHNYQQQLPALPKERYLMCHLFHSPYAPRYHRPSGFYACTNPHIAVPEDKLWYMKQTSLGSVDSGIHRVCLEIDFMARTDAAENLDDQSMLASRMQYTRVVPRTLKPNLQRRFADQANSPADTRIVKRPRENFTRADEPKRLITSEELSQGDIEDSGNSTRATGRKISLSKDSGGSVRTSGDSLLPTQIMETHDRSALLTWNWKLRAAKEIEMSVKSDKQQWAAAQDDRAVRCECSCDWEELAMLQCDCCRKLQHYHCYGFTPETHVPYHYCYQCLLEDTHATLLGDMKSLAIFRRALWVLYEKLPASPTEFAQKLHLDEKTTQGLIKRLEAGGYLAAVGRRRLCPITTPEQLLFMSRLYHNPLTSISSFYERRGNTPTADTNTEDGDSEPKRIKLQALREVGFNG